MIKLEDIGSLTDFARNTKAHLKRLKRTGHPEMKLEHLEKEQQQGAPPKK